MRPSRRFILPPSSFILALALLLPSLASAQTTSWWDDNGNAAGTTATPNGIWGTSAFWSSSSTGTATPTNATTTALDTLNFSADTTATGSYGITVNGTQNARKLLIQEGTVTFSGGTIALGAGSFSSTGVTVLTGAGDATISSDLSIAGATTFDIGVGRTLTLNTGTFTRSVGAALNLLSTGTVTSTMMGLSGNNATGIVGTWASIGTGTALQYATFTGSTLTAFTGTAAANAAALTDTTGQVNYDLASATGTVPATVSANTIRNSGGLGSTNPGATLFSVNGLMNATGSSWLLSGNSLTIGAERELVVSGASLSSTYISSVIRNNAGGASGLTLTSGSLYLSGANTYTGPTIIAGGSLYIGNGSATGSLSPLSDIVNNSALRFNRSSGTLTQGTDFSSVISGTGTVYSSSTGTVVLNGVNTFTGGFQITAGKVSVATIGNAGVPGPLGASSSTFSTNLNLNGGALQYTGVSASTNRPFNVSSSFTGTIEVMNSSTDLTFNGSGSGGGGTLVKTGLGTLTLASSSTRSGLTNVSQGTLQVTVNDALGTNALGTSVTSGAALKLGDVNYSTTEALALNGTGISGGGALVNSGTSTFAGPVTAATSASISAGGDTLNLTGGLVKNGTTLTLMGGGRINITGTGISGASANSDLVVDGTTVVVGVASNYNGPTTVQNNGTFVANAAITTTAVTVSSGSTLSGTGSLQNGAGLILMNGALVVGDPTLGSPVVSQFTLGGTGDVDLAATSSISMDLFTNVGDNTAIAASADRVKLFGTLDASLGGTLVLGNPAAMTGFAAGDMWTLFDLTSGGSLSGALALDYSSLLLGPGLTGSLNNATGVFSIATVPEPSRALLLMLGLVGAGARRRRR